MSVSIEKKRCPECGYDTPVTVEDKLSRHRLPAPKHNGHPIFNKGQMVLGKWCKGSGTPVGTIHGVYRKDEL